MQTEFQKLLTLDLNRRDAIPSPSKKRLEEEVWQGRLDYLNAPNANARNSIKQSLIKKASYIVDVESMKTNIATTILDEEEFGKNPEEKFCTTEDKVVVSLKGLKDILYSFAFCCNTSSWSSSKRFGCALY